MNSATLTKRAQQLFCKAHYQQLKIYTTLYLYTVTGPRNPRTVCLIYPRIVLCKNPQGGLTCRNPPIRINKLSRLRTFTLVTHKKSMQPETFFLFFPTIFTVLHCIHYSM